MVHIQAARQPTVFGYNQPAPAPAATMAKATTINQDIKNATAAIKASVANSSSSNRTSYVVGGLALLAIGALAYQNYQQAQEIDLLNISLSNWQSTPPLQCPQTGPTISPNFDTTPYNEQALLDSQTCWEILSYTNKEETSTPAKMQQFVKNLFSQSNEEIAEHLSEELEELAVLYNGKHYEHSESISTLGALVYHGCDNTLESNKHLFEKMDAITLQDAATSAARTGNMKLWNEIMDALAPKVAPEDLPFGQHLYESDFFDPTDNQVEITIKVDLGKHFPLDSLLTPLNALSNSKKQTYITNSKHFSNYLEARLKSAISNPENHNRETVEKEVIKLIKGHFRDNPKLLTQLLLDPSIAAGIDNMGIRASVNRQLQQFNRQSSAIQTTEN